MQVKRKRDGTYNVSFQAYEDDRLEWVALATAHGGLCTKEKLKGRGVLFLKFSFKSREDVVAFMAEQYHS